ncbi:MAG: DUF882 domain-containing protein, partial [Desulfobacterales bacterium]
NGFPKRSFVCAASLFMMQPQRRMPFRRLPMKIPLAIISPLLALLMILVPLTATAGKGRFFHSGDGRLQLVSEKNGRSFTGAYRHNGGGYDETALRAICDVFDAPYDPTHPRLSLRLIAFLDFLQDRLRADALITVTSGYRSPQYNTAVRTRGGLAAKASLHQYGMAADIVMDGVPSEQVWKTVKALKFGGAGYYHGRTVHVDVGPARSWDETTSGVGTGISDDNKLIALVTDFDVYRPGDKMIMRFIRMTAFPIGVAPTFVLEHRDGAAAVTAAMPFEPTFAVQRQAACPRFEDIDQMADIGWNLPKNLPPGRYRIRAQFCGITWEEMPPDVTTPLFEVRAP